MTRQRVHHVTYLWLVCMLLCLQCDVTTGAVEKRLVEQVTCTCHNESLIVLILRDTTTNNMVWYDTHSNACGQNFTFSQCSPSSEYVSVKAVITDLESHPQGTRVLTCEALMLEDQTVVTKTLGSVTITGADTTSTGTDTTQTPSTQTSSTQTPSTQTPSTQTLTTGTAVTAGLLDETRDNHGNKNTSRTSGMSSSGYLRISGTPDTPGTSNGSQGHHDTPGTSNGSQGHHDTPGTSNGSHGQHDTRDTSPMTVWMLGAVSAGLVLLVGLAALLAFKLKREKRSPDHLMHLIPESLSLHNSRLPVNRNSYLPAVCALSPFNVRQTPSGPQISSRERHLAVRRRLSSADHNGVYLTPSIPNSCPLTSDHRLQLDNPYTEGGSQEDRTGGAEVAHSSSSGIDDTDLYNSVADFTEESGESVDSMST